MVSESLHFTLVRLSRAHNKYSDIDSRFISWGQGKGSVLFSSRSVKKLKIIKFKMKSDIP